MVVKVTLEEAWLSEAPHHVRASSHWPDIEKLVHHAAVASPLKLDVLPPMTPAQVMERAGIGGVLETMAVSGAGPAFAAIFTNPMEVAKTRLQLQVKGGSGPKYKGVFDCMFQTLRAEGIGGLQSGLSTSMFREGSKCAFRLGLYNPFMAQLHQEKGPAPMYKRFAAGAMCGIVSSLICNPIDLVKAVLQAQGRPGADPNAPRYSGMLNALSGIARDQGVTALWKGTVVSMARSVLATSSSLAVNSRLKDISPLPALGAPLIVNDAACAMGAAFFAVAAMNPADVVRTRLYAQPIGPDGKGALYSGFVDCGKQILKNDGPRGFWRGAVPHFLRFGPHTVISFTAIGVIRRAIRDQKQAALRRQWEKEQLDAFDRFDVNADGSLDLDEVVQVVKRVYPYVGVQETLHSEAEWAEGVKKDAAEAFAKADVDNSGRIEKDEWLELSRKLRSLARERTIDLLFETLDADKSGVLQEDELAEALARMPGDRGQRSLARDPERLKAIAHRMMARFDDDGSGNLNIAEWRSLVRPVLEQLQPWRTPVRGCSVALALESFVTATLCHACAQCSKVSEDDLATGLDAVMTAWAREAGTDFTAMGQFQD